MLHLNHQEGSDNKQIGGNQETFKEIEIEGNRNAQAVGNKAVGINTLTSNDIGGNQISQAGSHNKLVGGNQETFKRNEIEGNRNIQGAGNAFNETKGNGNVNAQSGRDIGVVAGKDAFSVSGDRNAGNALGNHNTIHNHYHHPAYDDLLQRYMVLVDKYTRLLEERAAQIVSNSLSGYGNHREVTAPVRVPAKATKRNQAQTSHP